MMSIIPYLSLSVPSQIASRVRHTSDRADIALPPTAEDQLTIRSRSPLYNMILISAMKPREDRTLTIGLESDIRSSTPKIHPC
jgi:hypothetical protein